MKRYAICEAKHVIIIECWELLGYHMLKELPQDGGWHWNLGCVVGEVDTSGFCFSSLPHEESELGRQKSWAGEHWDRHATWAIGKATSMEEARRIAIDRHRLICDLPLEPMYIEGRLAGSFQDGYGNTVE